MVLADCRPAYRWRDVSYIVAPAPEKAMPTALSSVWSEARSLLTTAEEWVVVGYSAPPYDTAIAGLLSTSAAGALRRIRIVDPNEIVGERFRALAGADVDVEWIDSLDHFCDALQSAGSEPSGCA